VGSEYLGPYPDPHAPQPQRPVSAPNNDTQPHEPAYREHVTGGLGTHPADAPYFRPAYVPPPPSFQGPQAPGYPAYGYPPQGQQPQQAPGYPAYGYPPQGQYYHGYAPYGAHPAYPPYYNYALYPPYYYYYPPQSPKLSRDGYLFGMAIASFICSIFVLLGGLLSFMILLLTTFIPEGGSITAAQLFSGQVLYTALGIAGTVGGAFSLYHSIRSLFLKKPSAAFKLPWFWIFLVLYILILILAAVMRADGQAISNIPLTVFLIMLAGILPALTILALGVRRIHFPRTAPWPTSWRRFTLAIVSGATLAIVLASIFELVLTVILVHSFGISNIALDNPDQQIPQNPQVIAAIFVLVSVIAPLVEEAVKPLAVVVMIGRIRSAAEAFVLGLSCGIGFDLIETSGYISMGYKDWLDVAMQRSAAGLLHGLGAAMVALGWYYLTHPKECKHRFLLAFGCWAYAILQHAIWNGSFGLQLLPAPIGPYLDNGTLAIGSVSMPSFILVYIVESALMLAFFLYMTRKVRPKAPPSTTAAEPPPPLAVRQPIAEPVNQVGAHR
jgi:RsiW-degrading membrane proteinase PrsW (M82 family)